MRRLFGLIVGMLPAIAGASSLDVDPIRVNFTAQNTVAVVTLSNSGDNPATVQLEPVVWSQENGEDVYTPTRELLATPPIFTVQPHQKQIIRLGLRVPPDARREKSYRLYLQEVPSAEQQKGLGVVMALRIGVPVFVDPLTPTTPVLHWVARRASDKEVDLSVTNTGGSHIQIRTITLSGAGSGQPLQVQQAIYVLTGKSHTWALKQGTRVAAAGASVHVQCDTDQGPVDAQLVLQ